jgi:predicted fused transcriptional regulator/phosphomethylpyrimidine kinase/predicted transcriptional regulator
MKFIEEVVVEAFLPTVRSMLAEALRERGLTQREVAQALGISQSAVSKYAKGEVDREPAVLEDDRVRSLVDELAEGLASGEMTQVQALVELEVLIRRLERGDVLSTLHAQAMPELAGRTGDFAVHDPDSELRTTERVLASVRRGLVVLERTAGITELIPNVGSNLVEATPNAAEINDVAGVPGRLFDVKGQLAVPGDPEFGASGHVATVLLAARAGGSQARSAINLRYDELLLESLRDDGTVVEYDPEVEDLAATIEAAVAGVEKPAAVDVIYQTGGFGIEPIVYLLGADAAAVARRVRSLDPSST